MVKLPDNALFSNGDPLDAQAFKDAWLRYKTISPYSFDFEMLKDINVVDNRTVGLQRNLERFTRAVER
jgi:ABC-type transport system substrate-binding protein